MDSGGPLPNPGTFTLEPTDDETAPSAITLTASPGSVAEDANATAITVTAAVGGATTFSDEGLAFVGLNADRVRILPGADDDRAAHQQKGGVTFANRYPPEEDRADASGLTVGGLSQEEP